MNGRTSMKEIIKAYTQSSTRWLLQSSIWPVQVAETEISSLFLNSNRQACLPLPEKEKKNHFRSQLGRSERNFQEKNKNEIWTNLAEFNRNARCGDREEGGGMEQVPEAGGAQAPEEVHPIIPVSLALDLQGGATAPRCGGDRDERRRRFAAEPWEREQRQQRRAEGERRRPAARWESPGSEARWFPPWRPTKQRKGMGERTRIESWGFWLIFYSIDPFFLQDVFIFVLLGI